MKYCQRLLVKHFYATYRAIFEKLFKTRSGDRSYTVDLLTAFNYY